ncbi:Synaptic vesicle glycoprotein 2B, partial [Gryllus bimaculatus]
MAAEQPQRVRSAARPADAQPLSPRALGAQEAFGRAPGPGLGPGLAPGLAGKGGDEGTDIEEALALTGYGLFNVALLLSGVLSALSHQGNTAMLSYLLPAAECDLGLTPATKGVLAATPYAGMLCSALTWGFLSDTVGRRRLLVALYLLDGAVNLASSLTQAFWLLLLLRFVGGF